MSRRVYIGDGLYVELHNREELEVYSSNGVEKKPSIFFTTQMVEDLLRIAQKEFAVPLQEKQ